MIEYANKMGKNSHKLELPAIFKKRDKKNRVVLVPNLSPEFSRVMELALRSCGFKARRVPLAGPEAVELGKQYVHNDICFPAQINIGELLYELQTGGYNRDEVAFGLSKNCNSCRALQYYALARKGLDESGYSDVPVVTSGRDELGLQPGFRLGFLFRIKSMQGLIITDALNLMRDRVISYELNEGETLRVHEHQMKICLKALEKSFRSALGALKGAVLEFNAIQSKRNERKPMVGIVGEILVNYHPTANYNLVKYLRENGMEVILPPLLEFFRQDIFNLEESYRRRLTRYPIIDKIHAKFQELIYNHHLNPSENILKNFKYYEEREDIRTIAAYANGIIDATFYSGEGWLLPGEIVSMIKKGVRSFVIVQPFGCLPNHISGRGTIKSIKKLYPRVQILSLDYDPDVSLGNIENRLQMLIISAREMKKEDSIPIKQETLSRAI